MSLTAPPKAVWASKTIWLNVLGLAGSLLGLIPPTETSLAIGAAANVLLRLVTKKPVTIDPEKVP